MTRRVLVLHDHAEARELTRVSLARLGGFAVVASGCGRQGIALAAEHRPDAIVLGVGEAAGDGVQTLSALAADAQTRAIPVVVLAAESSFQERRRLRELGARQVVASPSDPLALPALVSEALGW